MKTFNLFGDVIGGEAERWDYSEVAPAQVAAFLKNAGGEAVEININSNGGSVTGGIAIANMLKAYPGEVTCNVLGVAASIASVIACAGKTLAMGEGSFLMVHNPFAYTSGTAEELRKDADTLDKMRDAIIAIYKGKCGDKEDELKMLMDDESWLSRDEARKFGFAVADYEGELKAAASLTRRAYDKAPEGAKALLKFEAKKPAAEKPAENAAENAVEAATEAPEAQAEAPAENPAPAEGTQQNAANAAVDATPVATPEEETAAPAPEEKAQKPADNWEARFKGLSTKYNQLQAAHKAALDALTAERDNFKSQYNQAAQDLTVAKAKVSELTTQVEEGTKALTKANADLAEVRNSLTKANEQVAHLEATRDMLTAGVLTPPAESSYKAKMAKAKTPEEREALRNAKKAGKIN